MDKNGGKVMNIIKTTKVDYRLRDVQFQDGVLVDENGEAIDIVKNLKTIYGDREFTITATVTSKKEYDVEDFS